MITYPWDIDGLDGDDTGPRQLWPWRFPLRRGRHRRRAAKFYEESTKEQTDEQA